LSECGLIATGPREPRRGAPYTFVTTEAFLAAFDLASLADLPDREQLEDAGLAQAQAKGSDHDGDVRRA
jgi:chromosome segregation and condensation protein ScpB